MSPFRLNVALVAFGSLVSLGSLAGCAGNAGDAPQEDTRAVASDLRTPATELRRLDEMRALDDDDAGNPAPDGGTRACIDVVMCMDQMHFDPATCRCEPNPSCTCDSDCGPDGSCVPSRLNPNENVCSRVPVGGNE